MITRIHITQVSGSRIKVSVIYNESGIRISRSETLFGSAPPHEVANAIGRLRGVVATHLATIQEMDS